MTTTIVVMIIIGIIFIFTSFFVTEKISSSKQSVDLDLLAIKEDYEFSERELQIIRTKIEDVIANQAKDILYETNDSLAAMANEKTIALGDYAVSVCDEIEKNHKEVMFLYSMLDDKQKEIMDTVKTVDALKLEVRELLKQYEKLSVLLENEKKENMISFNPVFENSLISAAEYPKNSALDQLSALKKSYDETIQSSEETILPEDTVITEKEITTEPEIMDESPVEEDIFSEIDNTDIDFDEVLDEEFNENDNSNDIILEMYRNGSSILDIAKQLGLGVGEVRLVIDLYQGE